VLAYARGDLRAAKQSVLLISPWLDDYVAEQISLVARRDLTARVLVRSERQVEAKVWERIVAAFAVLSGHWSRFEARTLDRLHAKCLLVDQRIAYVGSANWYRYSLEQSLEIVLRGPLGAIGGLEQDTEALWEQAQRFEIPTLSPISRAIPTMGITHEVLDPIAAQVLIDNPKAFYLGKKKRSGW